MYLQVSKKVVYGLVVCCFGTKFVLAQVQFKITLMYSLLNIGRLYLVLGFISILVYLNIPEEMNQSTMAVWILGLSSIYFVLGIRRLIRHYKENK